MKTFSIQHKKKWFTLLELVVVISIIWIILGITFRININRMTDLTVKNEITKFEETYNKNLSIALSTSIYKGSSYKEQILEINKENNTIQYSYSWSSNPDTNEQLTLIWAEIKNIDPLINNTLSIGHKPYDLSCVINNDVSIKTWNISFGAKNQQATICFTISASSCKIKKISCQSVAQPIQ